MSVHDSNAAKFLEAHSSMGLRAALASQPLNASHRRRLLEVVVHSIEADPQLFADDQRMLAALAQAKAELGR